MNKAELAELAAPVEKGEDEAIVEREIQTKKAQANEGRKKLLTQSQKSGRQTVAAKAKPKAKAKAGGAQPHVSKWKCAFGRRLQRGYGQSLLLPGPRKLRDPPRVWWRSLLERASFADFQWKHAKWNPRAVWPVQGAASLEGSRLLQKQHLSVVAECLAKPDARSPYEPQESGRFNGSLLRT